MIISEVCVCVLTVQSANIRKSWGIISQEICAVDCAKGKILNCVLIQLQYYYYYYYYYQDPTSLQLNN